MRSSVGSLRLFCPVGGFEIITVSCLCSLAPPRTRMQMLVHLACFTAYINVYVYGWTSITDGLVRQVRCRLPAIAPCFACKIFRFHPGLSKNLHRFAGKSSILQLISGISSYLLVEFSLLANTSLVVLNRVLILFRFHLLFGFSNSLAFSSMAVLILSNKSHLLRFTAKQC